MTSKTLEQSILSILITFKDTRSRLSELREEDFTDIKNKKIFKTMLKLDRENEEIDLVTLTDELKKEPGMLTYLVDVSSATATSVALGDYIARLKDLTLDRKIEKKLFEVRQSGLKGKEKLMELMGTLTELEQNEVTDTEDKPLNEHLTEALKEIDQAQAGIDEGITTGLRSLDRVMGKFKPGTSNIIGARPSIGKTALGLNIACDVAFRQDKKVAFFTLEMDGTQLAKRMISSQALVNGSKLDTEQALTSEDYTKIYNATSFMIGKEDNLIIRDKPKANIGEIYSEARKIDREHNIDLIIIDYLQYIEAAGQDTKTQVKAISRGLKNIARALQVPVITIAALRRSKTGNDKEAPQMSDLRDASDIEYDADKILMLHREYHYDNELEEKENQADVFIRKNRNGQTGHVELVWKGEYTRFFDAAQEG